MSRSTSSSDAGVVARRVSAGLVATVAIVSLASCACGARDAPDVPAAFDRAGALRATAERVIVPGLGELASRTAELDRALDALCPAPDVARLEAAREAWLEAYLALERTVPYDFGPARDRNLLPEMAFWPARPESVEAHVAATDEITDAWIERLGASGEGLFSIEYLIFEPSDVGAAAAALGGTARRCDYLAALGRHVARTAATLRAAWEGDGGHLAVFASASAPGNLTYRSLLTAESVLVSHLVQAIVAIRQGRLARPFGQLHGGVPQPLAVRTRWAHRSVAGMLATLEGARRLYTADGAEDASLEAHVRVRRPELARRVLLEMDAARVALERVPEPLADYAVGADHALGDGAIAELRALERTLGADVVGLLGVSLLPLDMDGD